MPLGRSRTLASSGGSVTIDGDMTTEDYITGGYLDVANGGFGPGDNATVRTNFGVQTQSANLDAFGAISGDGFPCMTASSTVVMRTVTGTANRVTLSALNFSLGSDIVKKNATKTITSVKTFDSFKADAIAEVNAGDGVTADGLLFKDGFILLPNQGSAPGTPAANKIVIYAKDEGGDEKVYVKNDAGTETPASRSPTEIFAIAEFIPSGAINPNDGAQFTPEGIISASATYSSGGSSLSFNVDKFGPYNGVTMVATLNNYNGRTFENVASLTGKPMFAWSFCLSSVADVRVFLGLTAASFNGSDNPATSTLGFGFSTNRGDTNLMAIASNGSAQTATSTGVGTANFDTLGTDCITACVVVDSTTSISFYVFDPDGNQLGSTVTMTNSHNIPGATTGMAPFLFIQTLTAAGKIFYHYDAQFGNRAWVVDSFPG